MYNLQVSAVFADVFVLGSQIVNTTHPQHQTVQRSIHSNTMYSVLCVKMVYGTVGHEGSLASIIPKGIWQKLEVFTKQSIHTYM